MMRIALNTITKKLTRLSAYSIILFASIPTTVPAAGSLVVTPTRVEFSDRTRTEQVIILNTGTETASYRATFVRRHMLDNGNLIEVKENEKGNFSDDLIRYSPRQVTLAPGQSQIIRLMLRKPRTLPKGEYRSHMLFQALPNANINEINETKEDNSNELKIVLRPLIGITIPVIVRHGQLDATLSLEDLTYHPADKAHKEPMLSISMKRSGTRSVYGDFKVTFTPEGSTSETVVSQVKGVAVYTPNLNRRFSLRLNKTPGINFDKGTFTVYYSEKNKKTKTKNPILLETKLTRP